LGVAEFSNVPNPTFYNNEVKMVGWARGRRGRVNVQLKVGTLRIISRDECLQRIRVFRPDIDFDMREGFCTVGDPFLIMANVSIYYFILLYVLIKRNLTSARQFN
jgi:hypothetical protein